MLFEQKSLCPQIKCRSPRVSKRVTFNLRTPPLLTRGLLQIRRASAKKKRGSLPAFCMITNVRSRLVYPFFFVIELPMPRHPLLSGCHGRIFPFLQIVRNVKCGHRFARISFDTDNLCQNVNDRLILFHNLKTNFAADRW